MMRAAALVMAALMLSAGCIGMSGDDEADTTDPNATNSTDPAASGSENGSANESHEHEEQPEPHWDNRTGEISGENVLVASTGTASEEKEIPATAREYQIRLTAEGGEIDGEIYPPECEQPEDSQETDCSEDLSTCEGTSCAEADGGTVWFNATTIDPGNWTVSMAKADPGASAVTYTLTFYYVDVHKPAPGHHEN